MKNTYRRILHLSIFLTVIITSNPASASTLTKRKICNHQIPPVGGIEEPFKASLLLNKAISLYEEGQYERALKSGQEALKEYQRLRDLEGEGRALGHLGLTYRALGQYINAIDNFEKQLKFVKENDLRRIVIAFGNLGNTYFLLGQYDKMSELYLQSLKAAILSLSKGEVISIGDFAINYNSLGQYTKRIDFVSQSPTIFNRGGLDFFKVSKQDYSTYSEIFVIFLEEQLRQAKESDNYRGEVIALGTLGITYFSLDKYQDSINIFEQYLELAKKKNDCKGMAIAYGHLGNANYLLKRYRSSIFFYKKSLDIDKSNGDLNGESISLVNLGKAYASLDEYEKSISQYNKALSIKEKIGERLGEGRVLHDLGVVHYNANQYKQAELCLLKSIRIHEGLRRDIPSPAWVSILETQSITYKLLQKILISQNKFNRALEISEQGRAQALIQLQKKHLPLTASKHINKLYSIENIKNIAREQKATLIEYSLIDETTIQIWVISPNGKITPRSVTLDAHETVAGLAKQTQRWIESASAHVNQGRTIIHSPTTQFVRYSYVSPSTTDNPQSTNTLYLKRLHRYLIEPVADLLPKSPEERIIFIPHRSLFQVPFAALTDGKTYLIHKHTILRAPSIQALAFTRLHQQRVEENKASGILIAGNPTLPANANFPPLPRAAVEAENIADILQAPPPLLGKQATETTVKERFHNATIIHLATHSGSANTPTLNPGVIVLAPSDDDDGLFYTRELFELTQDTPLNAKMVVLSACETGRGRITDDGVVGLSHSLMAAGVPSVVVSLWNIDDEPTPTFMKAFYKNLYQHKMDKAQALRKAMITTFNKHPDPKHWAAFTLIGEADNSGF